MVGASVGVAVVGVAVVVGLSVVGVAVVATPIFDPFHTATVMHSCFSKEMKSSKLLSLLMSFSCKYL